MAADSFAAGPLPVRGFIYERTCLIHEQNFFALVFLRVAPAIFLIV